MAQPPRFELQELVISDERATSYIEVPPIAAIAWIPHYQDLSELPSSSAFVEHPFAAGKLGMPSAFETMFKTGNPIGDWDSDPSIERLGDKEQLSRFAASRNFRGLLAVEDMKILLSAASRPTSISFKWIAHVGYTRIPIRIGDSVYPMFQGGRGGHFWKHDSSIPDVLTVRWLLWFKIGYVGELGSWIMTGHWAPSASVLVELTVKPDLTTTVRFVGTHIPSVSGYVRGRRCIKHDMVSASRDQIDRFLGAGACKRAPRATLGVWEFQHAPYYEI